MPTTKSPFILRHSATGEVRIVKAPSRTAPPWSVAVATTDDLIEHLPTVKVETAGEEKPAAAAA